MARARSSTSEAATPEAGNGAASSSQSQVVVMGIRHHGPGSARSVLQALKALKPDIVLVEGPPDADPALPFLGHKAMKPPVALLVYDPEKPQRSVYYPFAEFSPEFQAIRFALQAKVPVRFMDLPIALQLGEIAPDLEALEAKLPAAEEEEAPPPETGPGNGAPSPQTAPVIPDYAPLDATAADSGPADAEDETEGVAPDSEAERLVRMLGLERRDPLQVLAEAAGYDDGERWWEHIVEHRRDGADQFAAIQEAMLEVRKGLPKRDDVREERREAHMRKTIRQAQADGYRKIAVICGAWHAPLLEVSNPEVPDASADAKTLADLKASKVDATWVPWTNGHLSAESGYGAGIESPGWYHHLWTTRELVVERWMTKVARLLRSKDLDASSASVIEAVRLAETLAALRGRSLPGLPDLNEAAEVVFCFGDNMPMRLIRERLIVGEALGKVPDETPMVPLQADLVRQQKRLRFQPTPAQTTEELDLRKPNHLERSQLLHRLRILDVPWGSLRGASGKGTFKEAWALQWKPEFAVAIITASVWGNTIREATAARVIDLAKNAPDLPSLAKLVGDVLLADLPEVVEAILRRLESEASQASDLTHLMKALPDLADVLRYGNVRKADSDLVGHAVDGLVARICVGLPTACASLDDDAAAAMFEQILAVNAAIRLVQKPDHLESWRASLARLVDQQGLHPLVAGRCCRVLLDHGDMNAEDVARRMSLALSAAAEPDKAAAWIEGFLKNSGLILIHDETLWGLLDSWLADVAPDRFLAVVPLLRRTFSTFAAPERRQMGERAKKGPARIEVRADGVVGLAQEPFDPERARIVLPLVAKLLGVG